jgi:hypothetical protein
MKLLIEFDIDSDIIYVPDFVIENLDQLRRSFLSWIYNKHNTKYMFKKKNERGEVYYYVKYRGDAFVFWLNKTLLKSNEDKAKIIAEHIKECQEDLHKIVF